MSDLEKILEGMSVPSASVPHFQTELRRGLLGAFGAARSAARLRRLLAFSTSLAVVMFAAAAALVAVPSVVMTLNSRIAGTEAALAPASPSSPRVPIPAPAPSRTDPVYVVVDPSAWDAGEGDPVARMLQSNARIDREFIEKILDDLVKDGPAPSVRSIEMCTLGRYRLSNDNEVVIVTSLSPERARRGKRVY